MIVLYIFSQQKMNKISQEASQDGMVIDYSVEKDDATGAMIYDK